MFWASLIATTIIVTVGCVTIVLVAVQFRRSLTVTTRALEMTYSCVDDQLKSALDRLMARDFSEYKIHELAEDEYGGQVLPDEEGEQLVPSWDGRLRAATAPTDDGGMRLIEEDFPDENR